MLKSTNSCPTFSWISILPSTGHLHYMESQQCLLPWWPVQSSPFPAPLRGSGQMGGRCGEYGSTQLAVTLIDWCPSSERRGSLCCWSLVTYQCYSFSWRVRDKERGKQRWRGCNHKIKKCRGFDYNFYSADKNRSLELILIGWYVTKVS